MSNNFEKWFMYFSCFSLLSRDPKGVNCLVTDPLKQDIGSWFWLVAHDYCYIISGDCQYSVLFRGIVRTISVLFHLRGIVIITSVLLWGIVLIFSMLFMKNVKIFSVSDRELSEVFQFYLGDVRNTFVFYQLIVRIISVLFEEVVRIIYLLFSGFCSDYLCFISVDFQNFFGFISEDCHAYYFFYFRGLSGPIWACLHTGATQQCGFQQFHR